jgi:hypothetical protein
MLQRRRRNRNKNQRKERRLKIGWNLKKRQSCARSLRMTSRSLVDWQKGKLLSLLKFYVEDKTPNKSRKTPGDLVVLAQLALDKRKERDKMTNDALTDLSCQGIKAVTTASMVVKEAVV